MLFSHMSITAITIVLLLAFIVKYYAVGWILKTNYAIANTKDQGWVGALITNSVLNGILTVIILFFFAGPYWAAVIAVADGCLHYLMGYWKKRKHLPTVNQTNLLNLYDAINFLHTTSYVGIVALVIKYLFPNSPAAHIVDQFTPSTIIHS